MAYFTLEPNPNTAQEYLVDMSAVVMFAGQKVQLRLRFIPDQYTLRHEAFKVAAEQFARQEDNSLETLLSRVLHAMNNEILPLWGQLIGSTGEGVEQQIVLVEDTQPGYEPSRFAERVAKAI